MSFKKFTENKAMFGALTTAGVTTQRARIPIGTDLASGSEEDTGFDLPDNAIVRDVYLMVDTPEATGTTTTLDVGLLSSEGGGDADGFLVGADVSAAGVVRGTLDNAGQTLGALLSADEDGAGALVPEPHVSDDVDASSVSVTAGSNDFAELVAYLFIDYERVE